MLLLHISFSGTMNLYKYNETYFPEYLATTIYNPANSGCNANGNTPGTPFRGNIIPQACFSPTSKGLLQYMPDPSLPGFAPISLHCRGFFPPGKIPGASRSTIASTISN